jgi:hypothetical protein
MDFELAENRSNTIAAVESGALMASFTHLLNKIADVL